MHACVCVGGVVGVSCRCLRTFRLTRPRLTRLLAGGQVQSELRDPRGPRHLPPRQVGLFLRERGATPVPHPLLSPHFNSFPSSFSSLPPPPPNPPLFTLSFGGLFQWGGHKVGGASSVLHLHMESAPGPAPGVTVSVANLPRGFAAIDPASFLFLQVDPHRSLISFFH